MEAQRHPVVAAAAALEAALKDVADVDPTFMATRDKKAALLGTRPGGGAVRGSFGCG